MGRNMGTDTNLWLPKGITWPKSPQISPNLAPGGHKLLILYYTTYILTLEGPGSISCGQYLDRTLGKFPPLYGPHLDVDVSQSSPAYGHTDRKQCMWTHHALEQVGFKNKTDTLF